jgi:hypothetical protein
MQSDALTRRIEVLPTQQLNKSSFVVQFPSISHECAFRGFQAVLNVVVQESQTTTSTLLAFDDQMIWFVRLEFESLSNCRNGWNCSSL